MAISYVFNPFTGTLAPVSIENAHLMIGLANAAWVALALASTATFSAVVEAVVTDRVYCKDGSPPLSFTIPHPIERGGLSIQVVGIKWYQYDADASNYVDRIRIFGQQDDGTIDALYDDGDNQTSTGLKETGAGTLGAIDVDCSGYWALILYFNTVTDTDNALELSMPQLKIYYA